MRKYLWQLLVLAICLPVAILATGIPLPFLDGPDTLAQAQDLPSGDQEMAWLHTTTNSTTWERFVSGCKRVEMLCPNIKVDDSRAFVEETTSVPEVILSCAQQPGKLRIRWYKLTSETTARAWVAALAKRSPAPLAVIGGGSSDRALDLAQAMKNQENWAGEKPLLLITTATAEEVPSQDQLIDIYPERSFRFCFTNRQMAEAVLDFVWHNPDLKPVSFEQLARQSLGSVAATLQLLPVTPSIFGISWQDDPYSIDLAWQFKVGLHKLHQQSSRQSGLPEHELSVLSWQLPYSVGGFSRPNLYEAKNASSILEELNRLPPQRTLLILPTITQPARRLLRTLAQSAPELGRRMVAVSGDGIPVNALYRDGDFAWPVHSIPVPLVLFTHHNPLGWDIAEQSPAPPAGYELRPPNSTEDVLHFAEMIKIVVEGVFFQQPVSASQNVNVLPDASELRTRFHERCPPFFDDRGNRLDKTGEYVVHFAPKLVAGNAGLRTLPVATLEVWQRVADKSWVFVRSIEVQHNRVKVEQSLKEGS